MSDDSVAAYQAALQQLQLATRDAQAVASFIIDAAGKLRDWRKVAISEGKRGFGGHLLGAPSISSKGWPSADRLEEVLLNWHEANKAVRTAWLAVPDDRRSGLTPPNAAST